MHIPLQTSDKTKKRFHVKWDREPTAKDVGETTIMAVDGTDCAYNPRYPVDGTVLLSNGLSFQNPAEVERETGEEVPARLSYFLPRPENPDGAWRAVQVPRSVLDARRGKINVLCVHFIGTENW